MSSAAQSSSTLTIQQLGARLDRLPTGPFHRRLLVIIALVFLFEMADQTAIGLAVPSIVQQFGIATKAITFAVSSMYVGLLVGTVLGGRGDRYGRRMALAWGVILMAVFSAVSALSVNLPMLVAMRFMTGIGVGLAWVGAAVYLAEVFPARRRAFAISVAVAVGSLGTVIMSIFARAVVPTGENGWRAVFAVGLLGLLVLPSVRKIPESPRWLLARGRRDDALAVLTDIEETTAARSGPLPEPAPEEVVVDAAADPSTQSTAALFRGRLLPRMLVVMIVWISFTAMVQVMSTWTPTLLVNRGFDQAQALSMNSMILMGALVGAIVAIFVADRLPRRGAIMTFSLIAAGAMLMFGLAPQRGVIILAGALVFFFIGASGPLITTYTTEQFPTHLRARGSGMGSAAGRLANIFVPFTIASVMTGLGYQGVAWVSFVTWALIAVVVFVVRSGRGALTE